MPTFGIVRAAARALMPEFVRLGYSSRRITNYLIGEYGTAYRREVLLKDIREYKSYFVNEAYYRSLPRDKLPSLARVHETDLRRANVYRNFGEATIRDLETGRETYRTVSIYSDTLMTDEELEEAMSEEYEEEKYKDKEELVFFKRTSTFHNRGWGY